jgi:UDP-N-acetylmuramate dehydrogenase
MYSFSDIQQKFIRNNIKIEQNKSLALFTTMRIGGSAKYFVRAYSADQLYTIVSISKRNNIPFILIGKGSNLLISDKGFAGLAILNEAKHWEKLSESEIPKQYSPVSRGVGRVDNHILNNPNLNYKDEEEEDVFIRVESGARIQTLIKSLFNHQITGLQWFAGIPATVGGAIYMNMHGGPQYFGNIVVKARLTDGNNIKEEPQDYFQFDYDRSILHQTQEIILSVDLHLKRGDVQRAKRFVRDWVSIKSSQPMRSAGCIFKNLSSEQQKHFNLPTPSTGYIIDKILNLKGYRKGDAIISTHNAAFIENLNKARADDVYYLIRLIQEEAQKSLNLILEMEVQLVGDFI